MITQADNKLIEHLLNDREKNFCRLMIPGTKTATQAYIEAGYSRTGASANSSRLIAKDKIKCQIRHLRLELAEKEGYTQETQLKKLEELRLRCRDEGDSTGENASIREQNKLCGLIVDKHQDVQSEAQRRLSAAEKAFADRLAKVMLEEAHTASEVVIDV